MKCADRTINLARPLSPSSRRRSLINRHRPGLFVTRVGDGATAAGQAHSRKAVRSRRRSPPFRTAGIQHSTLYAARYTGFARQYSIPNLFYLILIFYFASQDATLLAVALLSVSTARAQQRRPTLRFMSRRSSRWLCTAHDV